MDKRGNGCKAWMWLMAAVLAGLVAGCGSSGDEGKIFGTGAVGGGIVVPGAACAVAGIGIPTVTSSNPASGALNVAPGNTVTATFSMAMNPASINSNPAGTLLTFTLKETISGVNVPGTVAMNGAQTIATFTTPAPLLASTQYTATITVAATSDAPANAPLGCVVSWSFTNGVVVPLAINLGSAATFGIASRAGMTSTGVTVINGNVALHPLGTCTDATGGAGGAARDCLVEALPASATGLTVNGSIRFPTDSDAGATALLVTNDLNTAWVEGQNKVDTQGAIAADEMGGKTFIPGVYHNANLGLAAGGVATLDPLGDPNAVFIFKVDSTFVDSGTLGNPTRIDLIPPAQAKNVWFVTGAALTIGSGTTWNGNVLVGGTATVLDGATVNGRILAGAAGAGAVTLTGALAVNIPPSAAITITVP